MAWSGSGTYSLPPAYSPEVNGTTVDAARYNGLTSDVAAGITACLAKNGENVPTANLPMGGFKHTGAADATATGQYIAFNQATAVGSLTITTLTVTSATGERFIVTGSTVPANGIYLSAANTLAFASNTTKRGAVDQNGAWVLSTPTSGVGLTVNAAAATAGLQVLSAINTDSALSIKQTGLREYWWYIPASSTSLVLRDVDGAADRLSLAQAGNVTINAPSSGTALTVASVGIALDASVSLNGTTLTGITGYNSSNTANSHSRHIIGVGGSSGGNPHTIYDVTGVGSWYAGLNNASSDDYQIGRGTVLGTTNYLNITTDGRWYGTALHNNAGAVTGATNQYVASGTYTPTLTNTTNVASSSFTNSPPAKWVRVGNVVQVTGHVSITPTAAAGTQTILDLSLPIASNFANFEDCSGTASDGASGAGTANSSAVIQGSVANDRAQIIYAANNTNSKIFGFNFSYTVL